MLHNLSGQGGVGRRCMPLNQFRWQYNLSGFALRIVYFLQKQSGSFSARFQQLLPNSGQLKLFRNFNIVVANEAKIMRELDAQLFGSPEHTKRLRIGISKNGGCWIW